MRAVTIPSAGLVTAKVRGSAVGKLGRVSVFLQSSSGSGLGGTALRLTFTLASYANQTFDTGLAELDLFGYATTP